MRGRAITDGLVELLIEIIHHIGARAERKVERELLEDLKRVTGKQTLLFELADAALAHPEGIVREVVFPVVGEQTLRDLVREWKATGPTYRTTLRTVIRNSYSWHYRQVVPKLVETLTFRSNNEVHQPVISALELVKRYADTRLRFFPVEENIPLLLGVTDRPDRGLCIPSVFAESPKQLDFLQKGSALQVASEW